MSFYKTKEGSVYFYKNCYQQKFISFTNETVFEIKILNHLSYDINYKHSSFKNYCAAYNAFYKHTSNLDSRGDIKFFIIKLLLNFYFSSEIN